MNYYAVVAMLLQEEVIAGSFSGAGFGPAGFWAYSPRAPWQEYRRKPVFKGVANART